jgi:hypothetical protein
MSTLTELNSYSNNTITFTDNRPAGVKLTWPNAKDITTLISDTKIITAQRSVDIEEIIDPNGTLNLRYEIDVNTTGATVVWDTIPAGCYVTNVGGVYTIYGIDSIADWEIVRAPTITIPDSFFGSFFYNVAIKYENASGIQSVTWEVGTFIPVSLLQSNSSLTVLNDRLKSTDIDLAVTTNFLAEIEPTDVLRTEFTIECIGQRLHIDPYAEYLELAIPFNQTTGYDDVSYLYLNNPKTSAITNNISTPVGVTIDNTYSKYYDSSYYATSGAGAKTIYTLPSTFQMWTTSSPSSYEDFTIEFWIRATKTTEDGEGEVKAWLLSNGVNFQLGFNGTDNGYNHTWSGLSSNQVVPLNTATGNPPGVFNWVHIAFTNTHWWRNGSLMGTSNSFTGQSFADLHLGQQNSSDGNDFLGNIQDFKFYRGIKLNISATYVNNSRPITDYIGIS